MSTDKNKDRVDLSKYKVIVIIPSYNESRFIGSVILQLKQYPVEILVVDDGSKDDTADIAHQAGVDIVQLATNQGKGVALNVGLENAREYDPDAIVIIDADGQHLPNELLQVVEPILRNEADIAIGSRYIIDASKIPSERRFGHKVLNYLTWMFSGIKVSDSQNGYRAFSPKAYKQLHFGSKGFTVESEMQFLASKYNLRVVDVPVTIQYHGKEKRSPWKQGANVLSGIISLTSQYRPLIFFSVPGIICFCAGVIWGIVVINRYIKYDQLAVGYAMICVLLCLLGLSLFSTGITLHSIRTLFDEYRPDRGKDRLE